MRKDVQHATPCEKKRAKTMRNHAMQNVMQNHVMQNHVMPKPCKKQAVPHVAKNKLFHMSCKNHAKTMQKPCKMRRVRSAKPPNIHSPRVPCYMCYMCYISQGKPLNIHSPRVPCYMCFMCYISQGKPLNIHSPRVPCYMCYMCYISQGKPLNIHSPRFLAICAICAIWYRSLYTIHIASQHVPNMPCIAHILHFEARTEHIALVAHIARSRGRVGVQRLGV